LYKTIKETKNSRFLNKDAFYHYAVHAKNVNHFLEKYKDPKFNFDEIINDTLSQFKTLGLKLNYRWTPKRILHEHNKATKIIMNEEFKYLDDYTIDYPDIELPSGVKLLNSKKKVYFEGATMGHCVYTNYWERIKKLKYVVFHVTLNGEEATLGCGLHSNPYQNITGLYGTIYPEQVYTRFNKATTREMKEFCFDFINNNKYMFKEFLINKQSALETIQCELEPVLETIQCELEPVLELELPYAYDPALEFAF